MLRILFFLVAAVFLALGLYYLNLYLIESSSRPLIFSDARELPQDALILVPGTGRNYPGRINYLFKGRVDATADLYATGKYKTILLSGIADGKEYDEANDLSDALIQHGIPNSVFVLDHDSKDTFATLLWFHKNYKNRKVIFVSQRLHLERMIWMAKKLGIDCAGYECAAWPGGIHKWFYVRERGARIKARYELTFYQIFGVRPN